MGCRGSRDCFLRCGFFAAVRVAAPLAVTPLAMSDFTHCWFVLPMGSVVAVGLRAAVISCAVVISIADVDTTEDGSQQWKLYRSVSWTHTHTLTHTTLHHPPCAQSSFPLNIDCRYVIVVNSKLRSYPPKTLAGRTIIRHYCTIVRWRGSARPAANGSIKGMYCQKPINNYAGYNSADSINNMGIVL